MTPQELVAYVYDKAHYWNLDAKAVMSVAATEGLGGGIGDGTQAFGPWQDWLKAFPNRLVDAGRPDLIGASDQKLQEWAWSAQGVDYVLGELSRVAHNQTGYQAIVSMQTDFEKSTDIPGQIAKAYKIYNGGGFGIGPSGDPTTLPNAPAYGTCPKPAKKLDMSPVGGNFGEWITYWICDLTLWAKRLGWAVAALIIIGVGLAIYALGKEAPGAEAIKAVEGATGKAGRAGAKTAVRTAATAAAPEAAPAIKKAEPSNTDRTKALGEKANRTPKENEELAGLLSRSSVRTAR